jgi:hypothetical protein
MIFLLFYREEINRALGATAEEYGFFEEKSIENTSGLAF